MTREEAKEKLQAYLECKTKQTQGIWEECNDDLCDNCDLCYLQGNNGEHKESVRLAIEALEKQIPMKPIRNNPIINEIWVEEAMLCPVCHAYVSRFGYYYCGKCGRKIDWSDEE